MAFGRVKHEIEPTEQLEYVPLISACICLCRQMIVPRSCSGPEDVVQLGEYSVASRPEEGDDRAHRLGEEPRSNDQPAV
jgi:hypothetical protein